MLWLNRVSSDSGTPNDPAPAGHFRMVQKNKSFDPHLLVVVLWAAASNSQTSDPFFHNVFSQFNGKRFDLGLYEAGSTKVVRFDHEGISYLFCNIHPEMGAVIITLSTPYFAVASGGGNIALHNVPDGTYEMHVWAEGADPRELDSLTRRVHIGPSQRDIGVIRLVASGTLPAHKNRKFGEDYKPDKPSY